MFSAPRIRRAIALCLLTSLVPGLAAPLFGARMQGMAAVYEAWLVDQIGGDPEEGVLGSMDRIADEPVVTVRDYVDRLVTDLAARHGLAEAARLLGHPEAASTDDLVGSLLAGLRSLAPGNHSSPALLTGPEGRSVQVVRPLAATLAEAGPETPRTPCAGVRPTGEPPAPSLCRPASGGAQPLGP